MFFGHFTSNKHSFSILERNSLCSNQNLFHSTNTTSNSLLSWDLQAVIGKRLINEQMIRVLRLNDDWEDLEMFYWVLSVHKIWLDIKWRVICGIVDASSFSEWHLPVIAYNVQDVIPNLFAIDNMDSVQ